MAEESLPLGGKVATKPFMVLAVLAALGGVLIIYRYLFGLGAVTNLSDGYPWGIWITYDVLVGTALGCGGYATALLVYILNRWEYHPLVRSAVLTSVFGYTLAAVAIFIDIGRYWNGYNLFLPWHVNFNSVLVEVALCIGAYVVVLWIELAPTLVEGSLHGARLPLLGRLDAPKTLEWLHRALPFIVALGILLPTMHQSSLGALMIIAGHKLSPLWQTPMLPLLFLVSAITMGYAVVLFESVLSSLVFKRPFETPLLTKLAGIMGWFVVVYLVLRFGDLLVRGQLGLMFGGDLNSFMFILESLLFAGACLLSMTPAYRNSLRWLFVAACLMLLAGSVYRFNAYIVGFNPGPGWSYFPALPEVMITLGIIAFELMAYLYFVKRFPVLPKLEHS